jgi:hypothetical protein
MTAVEWFFMTMNIRGLLPDKEIVECYKEAKEMEKQQHGRTWDAAIKAHDNRGHVHARSLVDFDEWYEQQFKK